MAFAWCVISAEHAEPPSTGASTRVQRIERIDATAPAHAKAPIEAAVPPSPTTRGERVPIRTAIPADVIAYAKTLVNLPMGAEQIAEIDGQRYVFVLERHYHPPGFVGAPNGWHKGVTAYELR
jgi:hypothetical protein